MRFALFDELAAEGDFVFKIAQAELVFGVAEGSLGFFDSALEIAALSFEDSDLVCQFRDRKTLEAVVGVGGLGVLGAGAVLLGGVLRKFDDNPAIQYTYCDESKTEEGFLLGRGGYVDYGEGDHGAEGDDEDNTAEGLPKIGVLTPFAGEATDKVHNFNPF